MQASPLDALHDVLPPDEVAWWPLSYPMWGVIITALIAFMALLIWYVKTQRFQRAKKQAIIEAKSATQDAQSLHIILKRLAKHYYGAHIAALPNTHWQPVLTTLSGVQFSQAELMAIYSPNAQPELCNKLHQAIMQFKLKEVLDV